MQPLALFLIAPRYDKLTENTLASVGTQGASLCEGYRIVGAPHKSTATGETETARVFVVDCVFSATNLTGEV